MTPQPSPIALRYFLRGGSALFEKGIENSITALSASRRDRVSGTADRKFVGLDAYRKLLQCGVDDVTLATPTGYRPLHLAASIEAGKDIFSEKPRAVDAIGYHVVQAALAKASEKKLNVMAGGRLRYNTSRRELESTPRAVLGITKFVGVTPASA